MCSREPRECWCWRSHARLWLRLFLVIGPNASLLYHNDTAEISVAGGGQMLLGCAGVENLHGGRVAAGERYRRAVSGLCKEQL